MQAYTYVEKRKILNGGGRPVLVLRQGEAVREG